MDYALLFIVFILFACGNNNGLMLALLLLSIRLIFIIKGGHNNE